MDVDAGVPKFHLSSLISGRICSTPFGTEPKPVDINEDSSLSWKKWMNQILFFSKFCAIWRDFGEEWAQWGWATPGPFWGCCVCQGEESHGGRGSDKTLGSVWELCCCVWMWGWVMFWACAEFGLWQVPGRYFVFCHSCLWFVQEFRVGGSGEIQDFYLTCNFGLFPEKKLLPSLMGCPGFQLVVIQWFWAELLSPCHV